MLIRVLAVIVLVASIATFSTKPASACTCGIGAPADRIERAEAAFVGRVISIEKPDTIRSSADPVVYTFEVEAAVKGKIGEQIEVTSAALGMSCGFEGGITDGQRAGILLWTDDDGTYHSGLCSTMDPDVLLELAGPLPPPDGEGPLKYLVGGSFGQVRAMGLDDSGKVLAYAPGDGTTGAIALCPGAERAVEYYEDDGNVMIGVRDLRTFELVDTVRPFDNLVERFPGEHIDIRTAPASMSNAGPIVCRNSSGSEVAFFLREYNDERDSAIITVSMGVEPVTNVIWKGYGHGAAFSPDGNTVFLVTRKIPSPEFYPVEAIVQTFDLDTGDRTEVAAISVVRFETPYVFAVSPDGEKLAMLIDDLNPAPGVHLFLVDTASSPATVLETDVHWADRDARVFWTEAQNIMVVTDDADHDTPLYNTSLELVGHTLPHDSIELPAVSEGMLHGLGSSGSIDSVALVSFDPDSGTRTEGRNFDRNSVRTIVPVPGELTVAPQVSQDSPSPDNGGFEVPDVLGWSAISLGSLLAVVFVVFIAMRMARMRDSSPRSTG